MLVYVLLFLPSILCYKLPQRTMAAVRPMFQRAYYLLTEEFEVELIDSDDDDFDDYEYESD